MFWKWLELFKYNSRPVKLVNCVHGLTLVSDSGCVIVSLGAVWVFACTTVTGHPMNEAQKDLLPAWNKPTSGRYTGTGWLMLACGTAGKSSIYWGIKTSQHNLGRKSQIQPSVLDINCITRVSPGRRPIPTAPSLLSALSSCHLLLIPDFLGKPTCVGSTQQSSEILRGSHHWLCLITNKAVHVMTCKIR